MDVKQEKHIDDYWNIDGSRDLSASWTGFTQFTLLDEKPPDGFLWSGERLTKRQATSRPDYLWPELWRGMSKDAKLRENHKWAIEKPKFDNARRLRGIYFFDPKDMEFKEIIKNARKNWKHHWLQLCLARLARKASMEKPVSWKPVNPQECVWKNLHRNIMRTILQERETIHYSITIWYTNLFLLPQAMNIPAAKAAVDKEWEKLENIPSWDNESQKQI